MREIDFIAWGSAWDTESECSHISLSEDDVREINSKDPNTAVLGISEMGGGSDFIPYVIEILHNPQIIALGTEVIIHEIYPKFKAYYSDKIHNTIKCFDKDYNLAKKSDSLEPFAVPYVEIRAHKGQAHLTYNLDFSNVEELDEEIEKACKTLADFMIDRTKQMV